MKYLLITGIRGVPASHGGFETFAEKLAVYLVAQGWNVTVYCQESRLEYLETYESDWLGVRRVHIPVNGVSAKSTLIFDYLCVKHALKQPGLVLTLGYNTAIFNIWFRLYGKKNLINMDGIEWQRNKWNWYEKTWLYFNERAGCLIANHLIADHPEIKRHLVSRVKESKITMIPYGAREVLSADVNLLSKFALSPKNYALVVARPEPENSILEIVQAFSTKRRNHNLVILGHYDKTNSYHADVLNSASDEVKFLGAVYDHGALDALRFYASIYIHGHTVGGTNPSLIEALGAAQPVLAHDNKFNHWVAGSGAVFFANNEECAQKFDLLLSISNRRDDMSKASRKQFKLKFTWPTILLKYEQLLDSYLS